MRFHILKCTLSGESLPRYLLGMVKEKEEEREEGEGWVTERVSRQL